MRPKKGAPVGEERVFLGRPFSQGQFVIFSTVWTSHAVGSSTFARMGLCVHREDEFSSRKRKPMMRDPETGVEVEDEEEPTRKKVGV